MARFVIVTPTAEALTTKSNETDFVVASVPTSQVITSFASGPLMPAGQEAGAVAYFSSSVRSSWTTTPVGATPEVCVAVSV